ncbi:phosphoribosyltransferase [Sediminibacterium roseum]|uniref:Phosphoribosyltransferase n=1 Tax=Sediminibacterium roseum TaxID=1978412 RepID=A0ABW9ZXF0_9BACT|nr:phosphoribosyltransferase [Sediminibacterium roseum]NCI50914.1 phosphoribosyltransferase [Sediminibacterium roseum]
MKKDFIEFTNQIKKEFDSTVAENKEVIGKYNFEVKTGISSKVITKLTPSEQKLLKEVESRFSYAHYFIRENGKLKNRNEIYYSTLLDDSRSSQVINLCMFLDTNLAILQGLQSSDFLGDNFILASILDDIRFKFIILFEDILENISEFTFDIKEIESLTGCAISNYYNYILGIPQFIISHSQLMQFVNSARKFIINYLEKFNKDLKPLRNYKEADIPLDNLLFISKLKKNLPPDEIHWIIGIRFGGIELPFLIKHFIYQQAEIKHLKISNYSQTDQGSNLESVQQFASDNKTKLATRNILIVDDSITTARTAKIIIDALKNNAKHLYFACVYHPEAKRIPQMRMEGHGGVNIEELKKCCVLREANYTASANMRDYLGRNKKFDLTKESIKTHLAKNPVRIKFQPQEDAIKDSSTVKVFIACDKVVIPDHFDPLSLLRNYFSSKKEYEIVDDWIGGEQKRVEVIDGKQQYTEIEGRNYLHEAINDIHSSDIVILYYPVHSVYLALLFRIAEEKGKEIWVCYGKKEETRGFDHYANKKLIQITRLNSTLSKL